MSGSGERLAIKPDLIEERRFCGESAKKRRQSLLCCLRHRAVAARGANADRMTTAIRRRCDAAPDGAAIGTRLEDIFGIAGAKIPKPLHHLDHVFGGAARAMVVDIDTEAGRLDAGETAAETVERVALGELVELVHGLDQSHRMVIRQRQYAETEIPILRDLRRDEGRELDRVRVPRAAEMMLGKPRIEAEVGREQGLLDGDAEHALIGFARILDRDIHGQNHGREIHGNTPRKSGDSLARGVAAVARRRNMPRAIAALRRGLLG